MKGFSAATVGIFLLWLPGMLHCDKPLFAAAKATHTERQRETESKREGEKLMKENPGVEIVGEITLGCK